MDECISPNLVFATTQMSDYTRNRYRLDTTSATQASAGQIITVNFPEASLLDMKSFRFFFTATCANRRRQHPERLRREEGVRREQHHDHLQRPRCTWSRHQHRGQRQHDAIGRDRCRTDAPDRRNDFNRQ